MVKYQIILYVTPNERRCSPIQLFEISSNGYQSVCIILFETALIHSIMQELLCIVKIFYKTSTVIANVKEGIELFEINHKFSTILVYLRHTTNTLPTRIQAVQNQLRSNN